ncbi:MAG: hypothetical protein HW403_414 [Dehalococcoidia bacterium]|nr:hypothetical protein [Dehalococcoidia bacterium]
MTTLIRRISIPSLSNPFLMVAIGLVAGTFAGLVTAAVHPMAGPALLIGVLLAIACLTRRQVGTLLVVGVAYMLPFAVIPIPLGGVRLTFLDATLSFALVLWMARLLLRPQERLVITPLDAPILLFIGLAATSFILGIDRASDEIARFFLKSINSILFYFTITNSIKDKAHLEQVVAALILGATAAAATALALYFLPTAISPTLLNPLAPFGYPTGSQVLRYIAGTGTLRATGTSIDPNVLGGMLMLIIPLLLAQIFGPRSLLPKPLILVATVATVAALLLTYSRSSWFGAAIAVLFVANLRYRRVWLGVALLVVLVFTMPQGQVFVQRFQSGISFADRAAQMRLGEYKDSLTLISRYPVLGVGFGETPDIDIYTATASIYLLIAAEMGLVGLGAFLLTMSVLFYTMFRRRIGGRDPTLEAAESGALAGVIGALSAGIFDHYFFNLQFPHTVALFWLFVALAVVARRLRDSPREKAPR